MFYYVKGIWTDEMMHKLGEDKAQTTFLMNNIKNSLDRKNPWR